MAESNGDKFKGWISHVVQGLSVLGLVWVVSSISSLQDRMIALEVRGERAAEDRATLKSIEDAVHEVKVALAGLKKDR